MGSHSRGGAGSNRPAAPAPPPTWSYGGQSGMNQAAANQAYLRDVANWRAPTTTGTATSGPPLPAFGVPVGPPTRDALARTIGGAGAPANLNNRMLTGPSGPGGSGSTSTGGGYGTVNLYDYLDRNTGRPRGR